jgi:acyl-coenzyme A synthetase/AMP-(fatty) acid ligase
MKHPFFPLAGVWAENNVIRDERSAIRYQQLAAFFGQLDELMGDLAKEPVSCIALVAENSVRFVAASLYLLTRRINFYLCPKTSPQESAIPGFCDRILYTAPSWTLSANPLFAGRPLDRTPASGAVLFSSSGTTGAPKYIYFRSEQILDNARNCIHRFGFHPDSRVLIPVPVNHMYGYGAGLLPALLAGANICLADRSNVIRLYDLLRQFAPDITLLTPSFCKMLLLLNKDIPGTGTYVIAGDRIKEEDRRNFQSRYGQLINLYGCTELGAIATSLAGSELLVPLDGVRIKIEEEQIICRHNAAFEYYVDREGNRKEDKRVEGWFRTGDRGIPVPPDSFTVAGRMDSCVNRNGFLVSLPEIETTLEKLFDGIGDIIALKGKQENLMGISIIAVIEMKKGFELNGETAKKICRDKMPRFMIPDDFIFIEKIPLLANGKPDRFLLDNTYCTSANNKS